MFWITLLLVVCVTALVLWLLNRHNPPLNTANESLEERQKRRAREQDSLFSNLRRFVGLLPLLWRSRRDKRLLCVFGSSVKLSSHIRAKLCVFSAPLAFISHLFRQDHPLEQDSFLLWACLSSESCPWWSVDEYGRVLELNYSTIRAELDSLLITQGGSKPHPRSSSLVSSGSWRLLPLWKGGKEHKEVTSQCPRTTEIIRSLPHCCGGGDGLGQVAFSMLTPGTHIKPHRGSVNVRLRYHLGLIVPPPVDPLASFDPQLWLRVDEEKRTWQTGKCLVFDDQYEHEVWFAPDGSGMKSSLSPFRSMRAMNRGCSMHRIRSDCPNG